MAVAALTLLYALITAIGLTAFKRYRRGSPIFWYQPVLALMAIGTFPHLDLAKASDLTYAVLLFLAHIVLIIAGLGGLGWFRIRQSFDSFSLKPNLNLSRYEISLIWITLFISIAITAFYYYEIGYNVTLLVLSGDNVDTYSQLRIQTYSGDTYLAPGYVNQFKNVLLPLCSWLVAILLRPKMGKIAFVVFAIAMILGNVFALTGTGQRGYLFYTLGALIFGYFLHSTGRSTPLQLRTLTFAVAIVVPIFAVMTSLYITLDDDSQSVWGTMLERVVSIQQEGALVGFQYIYSMPITWFQDLGKAVIGIIPGVEGSRIAHDIHAYMYGSDTGTVPLSPVGSAYYNGGILGVIIIYIGLALLYSLLYATFLNGPRSILRSYAYGFVFLYAAIYVADTPVNLLDSGLLTALIFCRLAALARTLSTDSRSGRSPQFEMRDRRLT